MTTTAKTLNTTNRFRIAQTQRAVEAKVERYTRHIIHQFKQHGQNSRQAGFNFQFEDAWEEFKDRIQSDESVFIEMYEGELWQLCFVFAKELPSDESLLLWMFSNGFVNWELDRDTQGLPYPDKMAEAVADYLFDTACSLGAGEPIKRRNEWRFAHPV